MAEACIRTWPDCALRKPVRLTPFAQRSCARSHRKSPGTTVERIICPLERERLLPERAVSRICAPAYGHQGAICRWPRLLLESRRPMLWHKAERGRIGLQVPRAVAVAGRVEVASPLKRLTVFCIGGRRHGHRGTPLAPAANADQLLRRLSPRALNVPTCVSLPWRCR